MSSDLADLPRPGRKEFHLSVARRRGEAGLGEPQEAGRSLGDKIQGHICNTADRIKMLSYL